MGGKVGVTGKWGKSLGTEPETMAAVGKTIKENLVRDSSPGAPSPPRVGNPQTHARSDLNAELLGRNKLHTCMQQAAHPSLGAGHQLGQCQRVGGILAAPDAGIRGGV